MPITVIKLGGSLIHSHVLQNWLENIQKFALTNNVIVVPGGGVFADRVREVQQQFSFDEQTAHRMALLAMSQYGHMLSGLNPAFRIIDDIGKISSGFDQGLPLVWLPNCLMDDNSEVPANWDFSSDSIALWLAIKLKAECLILVKSLSVDGTELNIHQLVQTEKIDKGIQELSDKFPGEIRWLAKTQYAVLNNPDQLRDISLKICK